MSPSTGRAAASRPTGERQLRAGVATGPSRDDSDFNAFGDRKRVFQIDAKIADCAVHLGVAEQKLDCAQIAGLPINLSNLDSPH